MVPIRLNRCGPRSEYRIANSLMDTDYKRLSANNAQLFHWFADSPIINYGDAK